MTSPIERIRPAVITRRTLGDLATRFGLTLLPGALAPEAAAAVEVWSVALDDRVVCAGELFVALAGDHSHGAAFASRAVSHGAHAVLTDAAGAESLGDSLGGVPVLVADDPRGLLGELAAWVFGNPAEQLTTFAVTGTNGKTTTTYLLEHTSRALGSLGGLIGTVEIRSGDRAVASKLTTPEAPELQGLLAAMRDDGVRTLAMEVSSHALALHRVDGIVFDVAGFTNLSQDHLDFHGDLETYFATKALLFTPEHAKRGVVIVDDDWGVRLAAAATVPVVTLRVTTADQDADWVATDVESSVLGSVFTVRHRDGRELRTSIPLPGSFNIANAALAVVMMIESGVAIADLTAALDAVGGLTAVVPGRMEVVAQSDPRVIVDFAHNSDALALAMAALRPTTDGRLVLVFGATGQRDRGKRPTMGRIAVEGADIVIVTDDDPHDEDAASIRAEVLPGALTARDEAAEQAPPRIVEVREIAPRAAAIAAAVAAAGPGDTVLLAGRGHEVWQEISGVNHALDDRAEARAALAAKAKDEPTKEQRA